MSRLKDRNRQVPNGMFYYVPETRWKSQDWSSFGSIVDQLIQHRLGNPAMTAKHKWSTDRPTVENEVDAFIANVCDQMGWSGFTVGGEGSPPPKQKPPSALDISQLSAVAAKTRLIWAGVKTLNDFLDSGEPGVARELAESRAETCVACPLNTAGGLDSWFTKPAAAVIAKQLERLHAMSLSTSVDDGLNVCGACLCPLKLKVWTPMKFIKTHLKDETLDKLRQAPACWIVKELAA